MTNTDKEMELKERSQMDPGYMWDLSSLFENDAAWEEAFSQMDGKVQSAASYQGRLDSAQTIRAFLEESTALSRLLDDLFCYANLRKSEDTRAQAAQQMYARAYGLYVKTVTALSFAEPEILSLSEEKLREITDDPVMADYRYSMQLLLRQKAHTLSEAEERLLASFGEVFAAPGQIADSLQDADLIFDPAKDSEGKEHEVSGSSYILLQSSTDRTLRENAFRSFYKTYKQHINTFAATYSGAVKAAVATAAARHYNSSREMAALQENVPTDVYDNLITAVRGFMPAMYRYVALRKKILGVDELHYYDVYAPLAGDIRKRYTYEQAQQMVLEAVAPLGEDYGKVVRQGFANHWIDVYPNKGKSGGAYSSGTYDSNPYIMTNFTGTLDSVSTIAHEMGHSMQTYLSNKNQPPQYAQYTIFVAEVASTVNENLLIENLLTKASDPSERLSLLNQYLENFKGTVYRQTMFAEFEKEAHAMAERGQALDPASLNDLYRKLVEDYFGPDLVMDDEVQYEWARIPHFYSPFYVYKYATSYSAAVALSEGIRKDGESAAKKYLEFLSLGGSMDPLDELRHAGVDLSTPAPVETALRKFESVLDEAENAYEEAQGA